jgi:hypothetical protein
MKTVLVFFVCLNAATAIVLAGFLNNQPPTTRSAVGTAGSANWSSQKTSLVAQLRQALDTAKQSTDPELKRRLSKLTAETKALIKEINQSTEAKDLPARAAKLLEELTPSSIVIDVDDELSKTKTELSEHANRALQKAVEAVETSRRADLGPQVEKLRETVEQFKREVATVATASALDSLRDTKLKALDDQSAAIVDEAAGSELSWGNVATAIALMLVAGVAIVLALTIFYFRARLGNLEGNFRAHEGSVKALTKDTKDAQASVESLESSIAVELENLRQQIPPKGRGEKEPKPKPEPVEPTVTETEPPYFSALEPIETEPSFPALVSDYLSRIGESRKREVDADFPSSIFIPSSTQPARFMFIANDDGHAGGIVLPPARLQRGQDFSSHYKLYYNCAQPMAGDVYILSPATVERVDSGWRLLDKGQMEIH